MNIQRRQLQGDRRTTSDLRKGPVAIIQYPVVVIKVDDKVRGLSSAG